MKKFFAAIVLTMFVALTSSASAASSDTFDVKKKSSTQSRGDFFVKFALHPICSTEKFSDVITANLPTKF